MENNNNATIRFSGEKYGNRDYTIPELMLMLARNPVIDAIENSVLSNSGKSIEEILNNQNFKNGDFENIYLLVRTIADEFIRNDKDTGEEIPRKIHHFWAGGEMSEIAVKNILKWNKKTKEYDWEHFLWTDLTANKAFSNKCKYMAKLRKAGIQIMDFSQLLLEMPKDTQKAYSILLDKTVSLVRKRSLLFMSDLARYIILYNHGGVYCDVDIESDNINMEHSLRHRDKESEIPMLGPCFRIEQDARAAGYLNGEQGAKEASVLRMYNKAIFGIHFIATRAGTGIMKQAIENATKSLYVSNYNATLGPGDIVKAMLGKNNNIKIVSAQAIPPWVFDINWITEESNNIVI